MSCFAEKFVFFLFYIYVYMYMNRNDRKRNDKFEFCMKKKIKWTSFEIDEKPKKNKTKWSVATNSAFVWNDWSLIFFVFNVKEKEKKKRKRNFVFLVCTLMNNVCVCVWKGGFCRLTKPCRHWNRRNEKKRAHSVEKEGKVAHTRTTTTSRKRKKNVLLFAQPLVLFISKSSL